MSYQSRVLVVDDQALMRDHMQRLLGREGYNLAYATNGLEALKLTAEFSPDLILLDVRMPEMDGFEVCRRLRADPETADIPIIMVTAFDDREARLQGLEAGADDFIPKPYDSIELRARVRTITRLNRYRRMIAERTKFQIIAERSENGYLMINAQDQCVFANRQARLYLGLPEDMESEITETFQDLAAESYRKEPEHAWQTWPNPESEAATRYLLRPETAGTPPRWLEVDTLDYLLSGHEMVWLVSLKDVSEQMASRHDIWKFQRAVHHKMRTPLIGMYSGIQFLAGYLDDLPPAEVKDLLNTAMEHGDRLRDAVEDILRYVDAPNLAGAGERFKLSQLKVLIEAITTSMEVDPVHWSGLEQLEPREVVLSYRSVELIFRELIENAKKFHPQQTPMLGIDVTLSDGETVRVRLHDDGISIPPEQLKQVLTPYYQAERNFTGEVEGMGLGLPTVASLIWSVGGEFDLRNRQGETGVEVEMVLPLATNDVPLIPNNSEQEQWV